MVCGLTASGREIYPDVVNHYLLRCIYIYIYIHTYIHIYIYIYCIHYIMYVYIYIHREREMCSLIYCCESFSNFVENRGTSGKLEKHNSRENGNPYRFGQSRVVRIPTAPIGRKRAYRQDLPDSAGLIWQQDLPNSVISVVLSIGKLLVDRTYHIRQDLPNRTCFCLFGRCYASARLWLVGANLRPIFKLKVYNSGEFESN